MLSSALLFYGILIATAVGIGIGTYIGGYFARPMMQKARKKGISFLLSLLSMQDKSPKQAKRTKITFPGS